MASLAQHPGSPPNDSIERDAGAPPEVDWGKPPISELRDSLDSQANTITLQDDGRLSIKLLNSRATSLPATEPARAEPVNARPNGQSRNPPPLNIVIQIVGSRGDVQPFLALGIKLRSKGHRVRIATHDVFREFVTDTGLEFFPIGGDPSSLMAVSKVLHNFGFETDFGVQYMVKNPGIIPKFETIIAGEISNKRKMIFEMLNGFWRSCIEPDPSTNSHFVADAIVANPPSFAHFHCAQALGIPLHLMFTMPWSPTRAFSHPLANIERSDADLYTANYLSYGLVEVMTWQGLSDIFNAWRKTSLSLGPVPTTVGPVLAQYLKIPFTYCWSPAFVPKPADWPSYIDVCGFFFRDEPKYTPTPELDAFLKAGSTPIYIGFGSIVMDDATDMTRILLAAVRACGVRAIISRGWSKLGADQQDENVLFLGDCPHEWLFKHVTCVVHHGGAGTTACGLLNGRPTVVVPFFGDQQFWGQMIAAANAGPQPIHNKVLNEENLATAIKYCLTPQAIEAAAEIGSRMKNENGVKNAVESFNKNLPVDSMCCDIIPNEVAVWLYGHNKTTIKLSDTAAAMLIEQNKIKRHDLQRYQSKPFSIENTRWDPVSAGSSVLLRTMIDFLSGFKDVVTGPIKAFSEKEDEFRSQSTNAALSVGNGLGKMIAVVPKTTLVDFPLALTEGLRQMPTLYGDKLRDNGRVTDWRSGGTVAAKTFAFGMYDGISGLFVQPYQGAKKEGLLGLSKGFAKGMAGLVAKPGAGIFGLAAYPSLGILKSIIPDSRLPAQDRILLARHAYAADIARKLKMRLQPDGGNGDAVTPNFVLAKFTELMGKE